MENSASSLQSNYAIGIKRIYVWENGDFNGNGNVLVINSKLYRSWTAILTLVTSVLKPTFGTVRNLVCLSNLEYVRCFESLESNEKYVALGTEKLKRTKDCYKTAKEKNNLLISAIKTLGENCADDIVENTKAKNGHIVIYVLANGTTQPTPYKLILTDTDNRSWNAIFDLIAQELDIPTGIQNLFTPAGDAIKDLRALRNEAIYIAVPANEQFISLDYLKIFQYFLPKTETDQNQVKELGELSQTMHDPIIVNMMQNSNYNVVSKSRSDGLTNFNSSSRYGSICPGAKRRRADVAKPLNEVESRAKAELKRQESTYDQHCDKCTQWSKINSSSETLSEIECPNIQQTEKLPRKSPSKKKSFPTASPKSSNNLGKLSMQKLVNDNVLKCQYPCSVYRKKTLTGSKQPILKKYPEGSSKLQPSKMSHSKGAIPRSIPAISEPYKCERLLPKTPSRLLSRPSSKTQRQKSCNRPEAGVPPSQLPPVPVEDLADVWKWEMEDREENAVAKQTDVPSESCRISSVTICHKSVDAANSALITPKSNSVDVGVAACEPIPHRSMTTSSIQYELGCLDENCPSNLTVKKARESGIPVRNVCCHSTNCSLAQIPLKKTKRKCLLSRLCSKKAKQPNTSNECSKLCQKTEQVTVPESPTKESNIQLEKQSKSNVRSCSENGQFPVPLSCPYLTPCMWKHEETATKNEVINQDDLQMDDDFARRSTQQTSSFYEDLKRHQSLMKRMNSQMVDDVKPISCTPQKVQSTKISKLSHSVVKNDPVSTCQHCCFAQKPLNPEKQASSKLLQAELVVISLPKSSDEKAPTTSSKSANIPSCCNVPNEVSSKTKSVSVTRNIPNQLYDTLRSVSGDLNPKENVCTLDSCMLKEKKVKKRCISRVHSDASDVNHTSACGVENNSIILEARTYEAIMKPPSENKRSSEIMSTCMNSCGLSKIKQVLLPARSRGTDPIKDLVPEYREFTMGTESAPMIEEHTTRVLEGKCCSVDGKWRNIMGFDTQEISQQTFMNDTGNGSAKSRGTWLEYVEDETHPTKEESWRRVQLRSKSNQTASKSATNCAASVMEHLISGMKLNAYTEDDLKMIEAAISDLKTLESSNLISAVSQNPKAMESSLIETLSSLVMDSKPILPSSKAVVSAPSSEMPNVYGPTCSFDLRSKSNQAASESSTQYAASVIAHLISGMKLHAYTEEDLKVIEATISDLQTLGNSKQILAILESPQAMESILSAKHSSVAVDSKPVLLSDKAVVSAASREVPNLNGPTCCIDLRCKSNQTASESATHYAVSVIAHLISGMKLHAYTETDLKVIEATISDLETLGNSKQILAILENPKAMESILSAKHSSVAVDSKPVLLSDKAVVPAASREMSNLNSPTCNFELRSKSNQAASESATNYAASVIAHLISGMKLHAYTEEDLKVIEATISDLETLGSSKLISAILENPKPMESVLSAKHSSVQVDSKPVLLSSKAVVSSASKELPNLKGRTCSQLGCNKRNWGQLDPDYPAQCSASNKTAACPFSRSPAESVPAGKTSSFSLLCNSSTVNKSDKIVGKHAKDSASGKELNHVQANKINGSGRSLLISQNRSSSNNRTSPKQGFVQQKSVPEVPKESKATVRNKTRVITGPKNAELPTEPKSNGKIASDREVIVETPSGFIRDIIDKSVVVIDRFKLKPKGFRSLEMKHKCPNSDGCCPCPHPLANPNNLAHENFEYRHPSRCDGFDIEKLDLKIANLNLKENQSQVFKDNAESPTIGSQALQNQDSDDKRQIDTTLQNESRRVSIMLDGEEPMVYSYNDSNAVTPDAMSAAMLFEQFRSEPVSNIPSTITIDKDPKAQYKLPEEVDTVSEESSFPSNSHPTKCVCKEKACSYKFECFGNMQHSVSGHPVKLSEKPKENTFRAIKLSTPSFVTQASSLSGLIIGENSSTYNGVAAANHHAASKNLENPKNVADSLSVFAPADARSKTESMQTMMGQFSHVDFF